MTITIAVAGRIATATATTQVVAGNTYPVTLALDSEWTGSLYLRVRFGGLYYDIPFASSATSVDVQMPVGYPEVGIGVFSEALEICTNEARVRLLRSILEAGEQVVEFDGDLYDQWAGEVTTLLTDDAFDAESTRPVQNAVLTAWKGQVEGGAMTIGGAKAFTSPVTVPAPTASGHAVNVSALEARLADGSVTKVGTADVGSDARPVKLVGGVPTAVGADLALDSAVVHTSGIETIAGAKTFTSLLTAGNVQVKDASTPTVTMLKGSDEVANLASDGTQAGLTASSQFFGLRGLGMAPFGQAPSYTADNSADGKIVTRAMLASTPTVVHTTGNETVAGTKTFSEPINGMLAQTSVATASTSANMWVKCFSIPAQNGVNLHFSVRTSYNSPDFSYAKFSIGGAGDTPSSVSARCTLSTGYTQATASMSNYKVTLETIDGTVYIVFYMKKLIRYSSVFIEEKRFYIWSSPTQVTFYSNQASENEPVASDTVSIIPIEGYYLGGVQA